MLARIKLVITRLNCSFAVREMRGMRFLVDGCIFCSKLVIPKVMKIWNLTNARWYNFLVFGGFAVRQIKAETQFGSCTARDFKMS